MTYQNSTKARNLKCIFDLDEKSKVDLQIPRLQAETTPMISATQLKPYRCNCSATSFHGTLLALMLFGMSASALAQEASRFEKEVIVASCSDPLQMDIADDGRVIFVERKGTVKLWDPTTKSTTTVGDFPSATTGDAGALGLALAPDFSKTGQLYITRVPAQEPGRFLLARFTLTGGKLNNEREILTIPLGQAREQSHCGGGLAWDPQGNLLIGVGDNMPPQDLPAVHPEDQGRDSRGTAGNTMELRGKILRITPKQDGSYAIPPGNFMTDATQGRPEIFALGVRNPFRVNCDPKTGFIIWGDVGGNVRTDLDLGPAGFDEINVTRSAGFFGWPFCSGPNLPWRSFDPKTLKPVGDYFNPDKIINDSKANKGLRELPPAKHPAFYYSNMPAKEWPFVGSGGRSITGGVVYHKPNTATATCLPEEWEGAYLFGDWMRNWVAALRFDSEGKLTKADRVLTGTTFKRPTDFKIGPDGALYISECGDRWTGNTESQITRIIYRRGNRPPQAIVRTNLNAGKLPLEITFDAAESRDADGDTLTYSWDFGDGKSGDGNKVMHRFTTAGQFTVTLSVKDAQGASDKASVTIAAGNEPPQITFATPRDGGFLDGLELAWQVSATDAEDGAIPAERLFIQLEKRNRAAAEDQHPGLALMKRTTCFACHNATEQSAGPAYSAVAAKYASDTTAREKLSAKILSGGSGVWGQLPMPPHPQHTAAEAAQMVDWVLGLAGRPIQNLPSTSSGKATIPANKQGFGQADNTVMILRATTKDAGAGPLPALQGSTEIMVRSRRQRAAFYDQGELATTQDNLDQGGLVARIQPGGWISFEHIRVQDCGQIKLTCWPQGNESLTVSIFAGEKEIVRQVVTPAAGNKPPQEILFRLPSLPAAAAPQQVRIKMDGPAGSVLDLMWVEFQPLKASAM
jgi:cytochrome c